MFYYVYVMTNAHRNVLYTGVTNNLQSRIWQHKNGEGGAFTKTYNCHILLYYEEFVDIRNAIAREKQLKKWKRDWKMEFVKKENPNMVDLSADWYT